MNDIIELIFNLIQNMNPLFIFVKVPLIICAVCICLMIIIRIVQLIMWLIKKQKEKN